MSRAIVRGLKDCPRLAYIVASSPRTGSYLLCEALESTGVAGRPTEAFEPASRDVWLQRWTLSSDVSFEEFFGAAVSYGTTPNGVYGLKLHWMHVAALGSAAFGRAAPADVLGALLPRLRFVHLVRTDIRGQAISYSKAIQTNEWWRIPGLDNVKATRVSPRYDAAEILRLEQILRSDRAGWKAYFDRHGHTYLTVTYEDLVSDLRAEVAQVLDFLGLDSSRAQFVSPPRLAPQADAQSAAWRGMLA